MKGKEKSWLRRKHGERAARALARQLDYQERKAAEFAGREREIVFGMMRRAAIVRSKIERWRKIAAADRILEVGCGAHGLVFGLEHQHKIGVDPLAVDYRRLFPLWQKNASTIAAAGEKLPFGDETFEIVLSDNVIDHAEQPEEIVAESIRVLKSGGLFYFTVNVHHPIYWYASGLHGFWIAAGLKLELSPFADHTIHYTIERAQAIFKKFRLEIKNQTHNICEVQRRSAEIKPANLGERFKKHFYKNAQFELIAVKKR
jgi:ubiquinone/menaquinone biosynthesis C-methylase UbiE